MPEAFPDLTSEEARSSPSVSGYGWTLDGMHPFFPGTPCIHCGKFVGRDGWFNVEYWESSSEIASMDAEHPACADKHEREWRTKVASWETQ